MKKCPVTGLPITEKSHWSFENQEEDYTKIFTLIGTDILHLEQKTSHDVALAHIDQDYCLELISEQNLGGKPVYLVMNCDHVVDFRYSFKKEFINLLYNRGPDFPMIAMYNIHPEARLQLEMFQALAPQDSPILLLETYKDALSAVHEIKSGRKQEEGRDHRNQKPGMEDILKQEFLATIARMIWLNMYDQQVYLPSAEHVTWPFFMALKIMQNDLKAIECERENSANLMLDDCRSRLVQKTTALNAQIELNKKNIQQFREQRTTLVARTTSQDLESTRISTATAEKSASLKSLCDLVNSLDVDPRMKQQISSRCANLVESGKREKQLRTELTEADSTFISKLQRKYPNLTQRELRIGLLIKLDYNSRDISRTIGLSVRGIESIRYRLHKKIGLDKHRSLKTYLTELAMEKS